MDDAVLFESAVICEYLDEVTPPPLHPTDPLRKAVNRAWIEFASELFVDLYRLCAVSGREEFDGWRRSAREKLERLEGQLGEEGPFFNGLQFALVDVAFAPAFMRLALMEELRSMGLLASLPKVQRWSDILLDLEAVRTSVVPEFPELFRRYVTAGGGYLVRGDGEGGA